MSSSNITICIPCYKYHIPHLKRCLDSIQNQTVIPHEVIISCSSSTDLDVQSHISTEKYKFLVKFIITDQRKNAAENRNITASFAETEFLSFFDADDVMHPQRIEATIEAIEKFPKTEIILHSYYTPDESISLQDWPVIKTFTFIENSLAKAPSGCAIFLPNWQARIHHSQVAVSKRLWNLIQFNESKDHERKEDAVFCGNCLAVSGIQSVYIADKLSKYFEEGATHTV